MNRWPLLVIVVCMLIALFNKKMSLTKIFVSQIQVYKNDKTNRFSSFDLFVFIIIPIVIGATFGFSVPVSYVSKYSEMVITIFALIATVLLTFVTIVYDKQSNNTKLNEVKKQTVVTIITSIIYSMTIVVLVVLPKLITIPNILKKVLVSIICTLIVKIVFSMMMILKRFFIIIE